MTTFKWLLALVVSVVSSSFLTFKFFHADTYANGSAFTFERPKISSIEKKDLDEQPHESFEKKLPSQEDCKSYLADIASKQKNVKVEEKNQQVPPYEQLDEQRIALQKELREISNFRENIQKSGENSFDIVSDNYDIEPIDPEWSARKEESLQTLFDDYETLKEIAPIELSCKSQNCRVVLPVQNKNQGYPLFQSFKQATFDSDLENQEHVISYFNHAENGEVHIYLSKNTSNSLFNIERE